MLGYLNSYYVPICVLSASLISEFTTTFGTEWTNKWFKLITRRLWVTISRIHWCYPTCVSHVFIGVYELQYLSLKEFLLWFKMKVNCNYPVGKHSWWTMVSLYTIAFCTKKRSRVMDPINCQVLSILDTCFYSHENLTNFFLLNRKMESFFFQLLLSCFMLHSNVLNDRPFLQDV